jgi:hypothetical protein
MDPDFFEQVLREDLKDARADGRAHEPQPLPEERH